MGSAALLTGCYTTPPPQGETTSASYAGDRASVKLRETVVAIRVADTQAKWHNLHVTLGAIINPKSATFSTSYELMDIISRSQPRMDARVVDIVSASGPVTDLSALKRQITDAAQNVFTTAYSRWQKAKDYQVEIVVTSLYLTDLTGHSARGIY